MLRIVSLAVALGACAAIPGQRDDPLRLVGGDPQPLPARAVDNPATPNQILDAVLEGAVQNMQ